MSIGMTPDQYYEAFVLGNYEEYAANPGCVRRAFNAVVSTSHLADHWFQYYRRHDPPRVRHFKNIGDYVNHISCSTSGHFRDIRSIANAYKHLYTGADPRKGQYSSVSSTGSIETIQLVGGIGKLHEKYSSQGVSTVIYTTKAGQQLELLPALRAVVEFWEKVFA